MFRRKKKQIVTPLVVTKAQPLTKKTVKVFNGEASAETALIEPTKKDDIKYVGHIKSTNEKFFDWVESRPSGQWIVLAIAVAFVTAVMYWGIQQ